MPEDAIGHSVSQDIETKFGGAVALPLCFVV